MAQFSDAGARCSEPSCRRQDYLPFTCDACQLQFCEEHYRYEAHGCSAAPDRRLEDVSASSQLPRCPAEACKERLGAHNSFRCWRCHQDVCMRHRFEDDHPCRPVEEVVAEALQGARSGMRREEYVEAHKTLTRVFGNIVGDPCNEKYRTLKKANAVVSEKLRHPACIQALLVSGFTDTGEAYVCRSTADLSLMRQMAAALKACPAEAAYPSGGAAGGAAPGGARLVNGVIVRQPRAAEAETAPRAQAPSASAEPAPKAGARPRSAFDFEQRSRRDARTQAQSQSAALQDLRALQKQRYQQGGGGPRQQAPEGDDPQVQPPPPRAAAAPRAANQADPCSLQ